ncbi:MAG: hypothetical protein EOP45_14580, partial [Sphingobacteriaceae bacterium]
PADDRSRPCHTCGQFDKCPGHRSYIQLHTHLIHGGHIDIIRRILQSVCFQCKRVKVKWQEWVNESGTYYYITSPCRLTLGIGTDWLPDDKETKFKLPVAIRSISAASNLETDESKVSTLALLAKYLKTLGKCAWCGAECDVTKRIGNGFVMKRTGASLTGQQIFNIFKDIRHDDCLFMRLGNNVRPEWFLFYCLDVVTIINFITYHNIALKNIRYLL